MKQEKPQVVRLSIWLDETEFRALTIEAMANSRMPSQEAVVRLRRSLKLPKRRGVPIPTE